MQNILVKQLAPRDTIHSTRVEKTFGYHNMKRNLNIALLIITLFMSGCGAEQALDDMKQAKAAYKACLADNPKDPSACKREKEAYENAGQSYDAMGSGSRDRE